jgi:ornithine cyclodeaminase
MLVLQIEDIKRIYEQKGYEAFFSQLIRTIEEDFSAWNDFDKSPRTANHVPGGVIELMPVSNHTLYSFKYVNGHPKNPKDNKFTVMATGQLSLVKTGEPLMFSEMTLLTAFRTACTSALAAKHLALKESSIIAFIGTGAQSEFQYLAFSLIFNLKEIRYYDIDPKAMEKFASNMKGHNIKLSPCKNAQEAVQGAHIITTMTADKANRTILTKDMITQPVFINAIGGDCPGKTELEKELVSSSRVVVEYLEQSQAEGEIQQLPQNFPCTHLYEVINQEIPLNVSTHGTIVFDSVGFALEDYSVLRFIYDLAQTYKLGEEMNLIPYIENVKDLYSLIKEPS